MHEAVMKMLPYFVENAVLTQSEINRILSESYFMVKGAALFLQQGSSNEGQKAHPHHKHAGDLPQHLQVMINILRSEDRIKLAVRLETAWSDRVRYMVVVYTTRAVRSAWRCLCGGFYCEHGNSDSCLQTRVSAGYVVRPAGAAQGLRGVPQV
ncbi:hypothetical protein F7725_012614 [Dissostichus mawsoni]|uniref:Slingshot N-terminal domain-containing protein n=1 Tax=Dissostichus mawsoni TaxID=36200 RepID=A0A7J5YMS7_DISMA|nr:hypothetical protein F7725_012614 [Dissostichus mawsoni]